MKLRLIYIPIILFIIVFVIPTILFFVSNLSFGPGKNFIFANVINKKLEKYFPDNELLKIKKGDYYYKLGNYDSAMRSYGEIDCSNKSLCFILHHNIGNTFYKMGETLVFENQKIELYKYSLYNYSEALKIKFDKETKSNYDFVLKQLNKLLKEIEQKKKKQKEDSQKKAEENGEESGKNDKNNEEEKKDSKESGEKEGKSEQTEQKEEFIPKGDSMKIDEFSQNAKKPLSNDEKNEIESYFKGLKDEEKYNINLNKPSDDRGVLDILKEDFSGGLEENQNDW